MSETLDRSRALQRYAESRNGILAHRIREMPQEDFDLLYADGTHQPPPLISFAELEAPLTGWRLDTVTRVPSARGLSYDVAIIREADGHRIGVMSTSLDLAFVDARAEAIVHEQRHPASRGDAPMTKPEPEEIKITDTPLGAVWGCKIGAVDRARLPAGSDGPMRRAVEQAFLKLTGVEAQFTFSGWGEKLTPMELHIVDPERFPMPEAPGTGETP